jgi:hypothetical protein
LEGRLFLQLQPLQQQYLQHQHQFLLLLKMLLGRNLKEKPAEHSLLLGTVTLCILVQQEDGTWVRAEVTKATRPYVQYVLADGTTSTCRNLKKIRLPL